MLKKKILWLHNLLQIEKAFRKKNLYPLFLNKPIGKQIKQQVNQSASKRINQETIAQQIQTYHHICF